MLILNVLFILQWLHLLFQHLGEKYVIFAKVKINKLNTFRHLNYLDICCLRIQKVTVTYNSIIEISEDLKIPKKRLKTPSIRRVKR